MKTTVQAVGAVISAGCSRPATFNNGYMATFLTATMARQCYQEMAGIAVPETFHQHRAAIRRIRHLHNVLDEIEAACCGDRKREIVYYLEQRDVEWMVAELKKRHFMIRTQPDFVYKLFISF